MFAIASDVRAVVGSRMADQLTRSPSDPSLPLEDQSLLMPPVLPNRQVRFDPWCSGGDATLSWQVRFVADPVPGGEQAEAVQETPALLQVDGSTTSLVTSPEPPASFQAALTMREYDDQLNNLKKENFNLKMRIYFMEERSGLLATPNDQENIYKVNIDLKVHSEVLKKVGD